MVVGVPRESYPGERRVSLIPSFVDRITELELDLIVQKGAGTVVPARVFVIGGGVTAMPYILLRGGCRAT